MKLLIVGLFLVCSAASAQETMTCVADDLDGNYSLHITETCAGYRYEATQIRRYGGSSAAVPYSSSGYVFTGDRGDYSNGGPIRIYHLYGHEIFEDGVAKIRMQFSDSDCKP